MANNTGVPNAVLDTNVMLAIYPWHDVMLVGSELIRSNPKATLKDPEIQFRAQRARQAVFLALYFDENAWATLVPLNEVDRKIRELAPPTDGALSNYVRLQTYFIRDTLMTKWEAGGDPSSDAGLKGNAVDQLCLDWAEQHKIPLISWQTNRKKLIPRQAAKRKIDLVIPEDFLTRQNYDGAPSAKRFLADWDAKAAAYIKQNPTAETFIPLARQWFQRFADNDWDP
jgi:hypothetical protein